MKNPSQIEKIFLKLRQKQEKAFIPFLTIGDPDVKQFLQIVRQIEPYVDILEFGIPFSDPIADGPTIQNANQRALQHTKFHGVFPILEEIRAFTNKPIVLLTYANIVGLDEQLQSTLKHFAAVGVNGIIIADIPLEESEPYQQVCDENNIDLIYLATPTTPLDRLIKIRGRASGYVYLVSVQGTTGARNSFSDEQLKIIHEISTTIKQVGKFVCVGFGISNETHIKQIDTAGADGMIVGSAIIKIIEANLDDYQKMTQQIVEFVINLKNATRSEKNGTES